ncbi:hypothetical protein RvY_11980 [Ramazzottius varieornatus]|uniref:Uncharacterized protein n=1 Tax=Ramazzottius varieornatus TaxID=947166 RepID=A0A1D1VRR2_RAMVA|nr:hypothetical protein RvY_11980 [Ramazzottius varieornatus]
MVKNQNKGKRKADTQKMGKKPSMSTSPIESIVDLTTSSANCVPPPSPSATRNNRAHLQKHSAAYKGYLELLVKQKVEIEKDSVSGVPSNK